MDIIEKLFESTCKAYNSGAPHLELASKLASEAIAKLNDGLEYREYWTFRFESTETLYYVFETGTSVSRPIAFHLFAKKLAEFKRLEQQALKILGSGRIVNEQEVDIVTNYIYTSIMAFACCYDLWEPGSRKSPGTFFEVFMAGLFGLYAPRHSLSKHVNLGALLGVKTETEGPENAVDREKEDASVSTDLVVGSSKHNRFAVLPLKITTRERIVQPFAHQRILESSFPGQYSSFLCCISETQLDKKRRRVNQICVPGTVKLFQKFLAHTEGLYYCDIPGRYALPDFTKVTPVKKLGYIFADVASHLDR